MRVTKIKIKNLFGIKEYEGNGSDKEFTGKNGAGKTSVIDAIRYALTNKSDRRYIVRNGESEGEILIETDSGLSINRKARTDGRQDYKAVKQNGTTIGSPEAFLKDIITPLQLSPLEFTQMSEKEQNAIILNLIDYEWDLNKIKEWFGEIVPDVNYEQNILSVLNDIQSEDGFYYRERHDVNRRIRDKRATIEEIGFGLPSDYDGNAWENRNLGELYSKIEQIRKENELIEKAKTLKENHDGKIRSFQADKEIALSALDRELQFKEKSIETEIVQLKERLVSLAKEKEGLKNIKEDKKKVIDSEFNEKVARFEAEISSFSEYAEKEIVSVDGLIEEANIVEEMKSHVNEWKIMLDLEEEVEGLTEKSKEYTRKIELARMLPGQILKTSKIPVAGLSVENGIPLIHGLPVSNLSEGEKLDLCIDVAIQEKSGLHIVLIDGIEKLSTELREKLYKKCKEKGIQFISTRTTDDEDLTVIEV